MFVLSPLQLLLVVKYLEQYMKEKQPNIMDDVDFEPYFTQSSLPVREAQQLTMVYVTREELR